jgi:hypothetical protein
MVENGGTGASSTSKSLLQQVHDAGGGKEAWEAQNKITEGDVVPGQEMRWNEVLTRNCIGFGCKSMCRDQHGETPARYDDSGRNPIGDEIVYHYPTSPSGTDTLPSEPALPIVAAVSSADFAPTTPISTPSDQQINIDKLRKQKSRNSIALKQAQTKEKANAVRSLIPHSPNKKDQELN